MGQNETFGCALVLVLSAAAAAQEKRHYTLFNPTPRPLMREMTADRPDLTESPYTVDAGHVQLEASFLDYAREDADARVLAILPANLKIGLLNNVDLQLLVNPYVHTDIDGDREGGFGNAQLRTKVNIWGNDSGKTALALMPFIEFPTAGSDIDPTHHMQGGLIVPFAIELSERLSLGLMAEFDLVYDGDDDDYDLEVLHTAALGLDLTDRFGTYLEYIGIAPVSDAGDYQALLGVGLTYSVNADVQLDVGCNVGLTSNASDFQIFSGITVRR